jgi:RNA recognition motif-containing protein
MSKKVYAGNLSFITTEETLQKVFSIFGKIENVSIIKDKISGNSKGFGFVTFEEENAAAQAVHTLSGKEVDGRKIRVSFAEEKSGAKK